jgi:hypothetical protein
VRHGVNHFRVVDALEQRLVMGSTNTSRINSTSGRISSCDFSLFMRSARASFCFSERPASGRVAATAVVGAEEAVILPAPDQVRGENPWG